MAKQRSPASDWAWRHSQCLGSCVMALRAVGHIARSPTVTEEAKAQAYIIQLELEKLQMMLNKRMPLDG